MNRWLSNFSYHTTLGFGIFLIAGLIALFVAILTFSFQSYRAAAADPADHLRLE